MRKPKTRCYLIGNVTLTQGPNVTKGDKLIYDLTTSQAVVTGRVRSMFIPNNPPNNPPNKPSNGAEGGAPSAAPVRKKPPKTTP